MDCSLDDYVKKNKISSKSGGNNFYNKGNGKYIIKKHPVVNWEIMYWPWISTVGCLNSKHSNYGQKSQKFTI